MLLSCEVAGSKVNCSNLFTRVPTDLGMCCALNWENAIKSSEYKAMITDMQESMADKKMKSKGGERCGLMV